MIIIIFFILKQFLEKFLSTFKNKFDLYSVWLVFITIQQKQKMEREIDETNGKFCCYYKIKWLELTWPIDGEWRIFSSN